MNYGLRKAIIKTLKTKYPVYPISPKKSIVIIPYLVFKVTNETNSLRNSLGSFNYFQIAIYVPGTSISTIDEIMEDVKETLIDNGEFSAEFTGNATQDFYDEKIQAYTRSIEFKIAIANG